MAVGTYALATLSNCNEYLGFTSGDNATRDTKVEHLIDRSTSIIESYCDRKFKSRSYRLERYDGDGSEFLFTKQRPIRSINSVNLQTQNALTITCEDDDAVFASIDINSDGMTITQIKGTGNGVSSLTFSSYSTVSAMGSIIDNYTSWTATVATGIGSYLSSDLLDVYAKYCLDTEVIIELPETAINDFTIYREGGMQMGILQRDYGWTSGTMNVIITYTAGYSSVPADVQQGCIMLVADLYNRSTKDMTLKSETLGDYSYTVAEGTEASSKVSIINASGVGSLLSPYKNVWVVG